MRNGVSSKKGLSHFVTKLRTAENMEVEVAHTLAGIRTAVGNDAVAVCKPQRSGNLRNCGKDVCDDCGIVCRYFIRTADVRTGNDQHMDGRLRIDIVEAENAFVLVYDLCRDISRRYFTKKTVFHVISPFDNPYRYYTGKKHKMQELNEKMEEKNEILSLPTVDLWDQLRTCSRPILVYGMGNGAQKLIEQLDLLGLMVNGVFASDEFVRGQSFAGFKVARFQELINLHPNAIILLAFGTRLPEVLANIEKLAQDHPLFVPDLPVAGDEYCTAMFCKAHRKELEEAYALFEEPTSRRLFRDVLQAKLTGDLQLLLSASGTQNEYYDCIADRRIRFAIDGGAYTGDTVRELLARHPETVRVFAVEPDRRNYGKLQRMAADNPELLTPFYGALWSKRGHGNFSSGANRNSSLFGASYRSRTEDVPFLTVDTLPIDSPVDYIKYDVEGAEYEALLGSRRVIEMYKPALAVSLYHRPRDMFEIPLLLKKMNPQYRFYLRRIRCVPAWELMLYAV